MTEEFPFSDLRTHSLLWAINRYLFHPRGYALALHFDEDGPNPKGEPTGWSLMGDGSEAWNYTKEMDDRNFAKFESFLKQIAESNKDKDV